MRGRGTDVSAYGIRVVGPGGEGIQEGARVWVELAVPSARASGPAVRMVKMPGEIRRVTDVGNWKALVVVFDSDFKRSLMSPTA
jgi:hypothetical protein